jgi:hypothetical protein
MKKSFFLLITGFVLILGCKKEENPQFKLSDSELVFNGIETKSLWLSVHPFKKCAYQITSCPDWLEIKPMGGTFSVDEIQELKITPVYDVTQHGVREGNIVIYSTLGEKTVHVKGIIGDVVYCDFPKNLDVDVIITTKKFTIENKGNMDFSFSLEPANNYISITNASGQLSVGEKKEIEINIHRDKMTETKDYESDIYLKVNGKTDTINVVIHHFVERKIHLESNVVDAEYSRKREMIVYVASNPMKLYLFHTQTNIIESIDLNFVPTCVSISPDQDYAVVGHNAHISYIDLNNKSIVRTYDVSCHVFDIVFGDNNWTYAFPKDYGQYEIRCVNLNLSNNNETLSTAYWTYCQTKARLLPTGNFIYGANNGLSPSDIEKYSIKNGTAEYLYDSPYHGDFPMNGDLWFSEDGNRIFTKGRSVFTTSELQEQDMKYNGTIEFPDVSYPEYSSIQWLDHSAKKGNLYILVVEGGYWDQLTKPFVYIHNSSNLLYKTKIELEKYYVGNNQTGMKEYNAIPYFVFSNSNGDEVVVITKAHNAGLEHEWAIEKININN